MRDGKKLWKEDCTNCLAKRQMIVVEDDGDDLLNKNMSGECNYSHHRHGGVLKRNYLNDAEEGL